MSVESGRVEKLNVSHKIEQQEREEKRLAEMMIPKKKRRLYNKIMYSQKKTRQEVSGLKDLFFHVRNIWQNKPVVFFPLR